MAIARYQVAPSAASVSESASMRRLRWARPEPGQAWIAAPLAWWDCCYMRPATGMPCRGSCSRCQARPDASRESQQRSRASIRDGEGAVQHCGEKSVPCAHAPESSRGRPSRTKRARTIPAAGSRPRRIDRALHNALTLRRTFAHNRGLTLNSRAYVRRLQSPEFQYFLYQRAR